MEKSLHEIAKRFVEDQIKIMKKHGSDPKLTSEQYQNFVAEAERSLGSLRGAPRLHKRASTSAR